MKVSTIWFGMFIGMVALVEINQAVDPVSGIDMINGALDGANKLTDVLGKLDAMFIKPITDKVNQAIAKIDITLDGVTAVEKLLVQDARISLVKSRHDIQRTRVILAVLADETLSRSKFLMKILTIIKKSPSKRELGINLIARKMSELLKRSKVLLKDATDKYELGQIMLKVVQERLRTFSQRVMKLADSNSAQHKKESADLRKKVYLGAMAGCILPVACPVVYAAAAAIVESEIARWKRAVVAATKVCKASSTTANELVTKIDNEIVVMKQEEKLVIVWESKINGMYNDYKLGNSTQKNTGLDDFDADDSMNQIGGLVKACEAFRNHVIVGDS